MWSDALGTLTFERDAPAGGDRHAVRSRVADQGDGDDDRGHGAGRGRARFGSTSRSPRSSPTGAARIATAVTVRDLLEHASGLPARLVDAPPATRREFEHEICTMPLEYAPRSASIYSDLGFILLGFHRCRSRRGVARRSVRRRSRSALKAGTCRPTGVRLPPDRRDARGADAADGRRSAPRTPARRRGPRQLRRRARRRRRPRGSLRHRAGGRRRSRVRVLRAARGATDAAAARSRRRWCPTFTTQNHRAGQFARARVGYDAADFVVRHAHVAPRRSATSALPARRSGSIRRAIATSCC